MTSLQIQEIGMDHGLRMLEETLEHTLDFIMPPMVERLLGLTLLSIIGVLRMLSLIRDCKLEICAIAVASCLAGCGPGMKDEVTKIAGPYYFSHSGGDQNLIERAVDGESEIVIQAKVLDFLLLEENIYVSRRPVLYKRESQVLKSSLSNSCEYWIININNGTALGPFENIEGISAKGECTLRERADIGLQSEAGR